MKVALTGASGLLGKAFVTAPPTGWAVHPFTRAALDITDPQAVAYHLDAADFDLVVNCAAFTAVDEAQNNTEAAWLVNREGPRIIAEACSERNILLVHISTDFVFDGQQNEPYTEQDTPNPLSVYGETKLLGEAAIASIHDNHLIVRTAWLYGHDAPCFASSILNKARKTGSLQVVDDQFGSPTYAPHLVQGIAAAVAYGGRGILHLAGSGTSSRIALAQALIQATGMQTHIEPVKTSHFPAPAQRPAYSALGSTHPCGVQLASWQNGVYAYAAQEDRSRR